MATILITGITGFIGTHLAAHLTRQGHRVFGTTTGTSDSALQCSLHDYEQVASVVRTVNPDVLIHLAALSSVTSGTTMQYYETNVLGTEHVLKAIDSLGGRRRIMFSSTAGVYGNQNTEVLTELLTPKPVSHYGISKHAAECLVMNYRDKHDITILRPFNVVGTGQNADFIVPKLVSHFARKAPSIRLGNLDPVRDYIDVDVCCSMVADVLDKSASFGEVLNVCAGSGKSVRDLLAIMTRISGHEIEVVSAPEFMRKNEVMRLLGDPAKINSILPARDNTNDLEKVIGEMLSDARNRLAGMQ
ncbi:MAG: GDP-mannose 4,6-dehydratase [Burkholderia sp.]|jgi:nucleoside-diphosphate-sugar epimerase|nr:MULTISPECIES: GDP-mannose 4,6-dehydratase [Burkholderia]MCA3777350.1 GDP-mannose 4,6-dehydratase [Burkholderia sp.]MCA3797389.1 GDP-mannose 4,6-dehydratase [Burkholderia sp.]MCA3816084.1 GDP-mannose 4,6-dehydratase [Burkholderia sp.]MCA3837580.1 GDP-mannose 4,6-dehydratase [Burkholderia sp.]MCA3851899.1 GDP-mannose 4,6-dehydratase [Burkholderia sp.]